MKNSTTATFQPKTSNPKLLQKWGIELQSEPINIIERILSTDPAKTFKFFANEQLKEIDRDLEQAAEIIQTANSLAQQMENYIAAAKNATRSAISQQQLAHTTLANIEHDYFTDILELRELCDRLEIIIIRDLTYIPNGDDIMSCPDAWAQAVREEEISTVQIESEKLQEKFELIAQHEFPQILNEDAVVGNFLDLQLQISTAFHLFDFWLNKLMEVAPHCDKGDYQDVTSKGRPGNRQLKDNVRKLCQEVPKFRPRTLQLNTLVELRRVLTHDWSEEVGAYIFRRNGEFNLPAIKRFSLYFSDVRDLLVQYTDMIIADYRKIQSNPESLPMFNETKDIANGAFYELYVLATQETHV